MIESPQSPDPTGSVLGLFVRPVHEAGFRYVVAGSVAAMHFSEPRLTLDVDIPIFLGRQDVLKFPLLFAEPDYYCPPAEILALEADRECRGHFNVIHVPTGLKADFYPGNRDSTFAWAWTHRQEVHSDSGSVFLAPPEYIVLWKLIFYREGKSEKHLRDIARMLAIQENLAHQEFLLEEITVRGLLSVWNEAQAW